MKRFLLAFMATALTASVFAQAAKDVSTNRTSHEKQIFLMLPASSKSADASSSTKALRHFYESYPNVNDAQWSKLPDGFLTTFTSNGNVNRVYYDKGGNWAFSVKYYSESKLAEDIRSIAKRNYFDSKILTVEEITLVNKTVYMIDMEDKVSRKTLRICDGEMEIMNDFQKL